jgi:hypothetical protein
MRVSLFFLILAIVVSCKKNTVIPPEDLPPIPEVPESGPAVRIRITNVANGTPLTLGTTSYTTTSNDTFSVSILKYYVTNISLSSSVSGQSVTVPSSYFLINEADSTSRFFTLKNIPEGEYDRISFIIGVDPARNTSGAQSGALDPVNGMFWDWNTGYIMAKMEGSSPQSGSAMKSLSFHIGGFASKNAGVRDVSLSLPTELHIHANSKPVMSISADLAKWFSGTHAISFASTYMVASVSTTSGKIADNYSNMFTVTSVVN